MQPTPTKIEPSNKEKQQICVELYNLVKLGFEVFIVYPHTEHISVSFRDKLERLYALLLKRYQDIIKVHPKMKLNDIVFERYDHLFGLNWEIAQDWLIGGPIDPMGGEIIGATDYHNNALGRIRTWFYMVGGVNGGEMKLPKKSKIEVLCRETEEALRLAKSVQVLNNNFIPKYTFEWNSFKYEVTINGVYCLAKTNDDSSGTKLMTEVMKHKDGNGTTAFVVDISDKTKRPVSQVMNNDLHINPLIRKIFFKNSRSNKLYFRSLVTREELDSEGVDTSDLDIELIANGAKTEPKPNM